jgi:hypothetical protein
LSKPLTVVEYVIFVVPYWLVPVMSFTGLLWIAGNKSAWHKAPFAVTFAIFTVAGLIVLTRIWVRRLRGSAAVGGFEMFLLVMGLAACAAPVVNLYLVELPASTYPMTPDRFHFAFAFLWPAPVYVHWLLAGLKARRAGE